MSRRILLAALALALGAQGAFCAYKKSQRLPTTKQMLENHKAEQIEDRKEARSTAALAVALKNLAEKSDQLEDILDQARKFTPDTPSGQSALLAMRIKALASDLDALSLTLRNAIKSLPGKPGAELKTNIRAVRAYCDKFVGDAKELSSIVDKLGKPTGSAKAAAGSDQAREKARASAAQRQLLSSAKAFSTTAGKLGAAGKFLPMAEK